MRETRFGYTIDQGTHHTTRGTYFWTEEEALRDMQSLMVVDYGDGPKVGRIYEVSIAEVAWPDEPIKTVTLEIT